MGAAGSGLGGEKARRWVTFAGGGLHGEADGALGGAALLGEVLRITDPAAALATIHWGRNYLYTARLTSGLVSAEVVVKQFRNLGPARVTERRLRGSKASRGWAVAKELVRLGIPTPRPLVLAESDRPDGPSFFVAERLTGAHEVRHFFRRLAGAADAGVFPDVERGPFLAHLGRLARRLHDGGVWYRDLSMGNVLASDRGEALPELSLVDFNRARIGQSLGLWRRTRDICRFPIVERADCAAFLGGYWGEVPTPTSPRWWLFRVSVRGYLLKHAAKNRLRGVGGRQRPPSGGQHHAHIPPAEAGAGRRDKSVWDHLSDQPHQHAGRLEKLVIRLADSPSHLRDLALVAASAPRVWRRYRQLTAGLYRQPTPFTGIGLALRPWGEDPAAQLALLDQLGVDRILLRLHPWQEEHDAEERLARALVERGWEVAFALPQNRDLVRDLERWQAAVAELGRRFSPYGRSFQIGQAINRSKWGVWTRDEYVRLFVAAAEVLRPLPGVELVGPAVIDFELQVIQALVNRRVDGLFFDVVSSLLYVDRRGAPENRQLGFDTVGKVALLKAIADTGRACQPRCWVTEVNWPLWEGPHSPAGRTVAVDEEAQASYLVRFYLLALGSGLVERVYWWQLIARGYGLVAPASDGSLRRRPSFAALATLSRRLGGATFLGPLAAAAGVWLYRFSHPADPAHQTVVGWSLAGRQRVRLPGPPLAVVGRDGDERPCPPGPEVEVEPSPAYFVLAADGGDGR